MNTDFINLTNENLADEHLCCIIRSKKSHPGIDAKRQWLSDRLNEGHVFRKLNAKATVLSNMPLLKQLGFLSSATTIIICIAYGYWVVPKEKGMENHSWSIVWLMRKRKVNLAFVCLGQKTKELAFRPGICQEVRL